MRLFIFLLACCSLFFAKTEAQTPGIYLQRNFEAAYEKGTRSLDGRPGPKYWQNRAKYKIEVALAPETRLVSGTESVVYVNNSPDSLDRIRLKLQHDLYKKGSQRNDDVLPSDVTDAGVLIKKLSLDGSPFPADRQRRHDSFLDLKLARKLPPGASLSLDVAWEFTMPADENATRECVCDSSTFFIPYFYPQIAVYDDTHGWADAPYNGLQEFYHEFADYDVNISLPAGYMAWATGELQNADDILAAPVFKKWKAAHTASEVAHIFTEADLKAGNVFRKNKPNMFHFVATDVPDFTFAASAHYNWDATSVVVDAATGRRTFVSAAYDSDSKDFYQVAKIAADGIALMSAYQPGYPFPYPSMTVFNGNDGMEYPMMVNDATVDEDFVHDLTIHEVAHTYFPFMMGTNEQYYGWMDEGWANFFEDHLTDSLLHRTSNANGYGYGAGKDSDVPPMVPTRFVNGPAFGIQSYSRPQAAYNGLLDLLGYQTFRKCMTTYMDRWKGKHPKPYDFFFTFNDVSGQDLSWFWRPWFFEYGYPDLAIKSAETSPSGGQVFVIERRGALPVPVTLNLEYTDGSKDVFHLKSDTWKGGSTTVGIPCRKGKTAKSAKLGGPKTPDAKPADNVWKP